ncbi:MAG: tRNA pseudouridine(38-40) synthase TruA, partial [Treponema sp.]|nr:tRNA pseudouridine(38-40) synthase TruA [Treponema sp.]
MRRMIREGERNIRLVLAYDGTDFCGWQRQGAFEGQHIEGPREKGFGGKGRTVQGTIEHALERIHKTGVALTGSGRTDAGVHAAG